MLEYKPKISLFMFEKLRIGITVGVLALPACGDLNMENPDTENPDGGKPSIENQVATTAKSIRACMGQQVSVGYNNSDMSRRLLTHGTVNNTNEDSRVSFEIRGGFPLETRNLKLPHHAEEVRFLIENSARVDAEHDVEGAVATVLNNGNIVKETEFFNSESHPYGNGVPLEDCDTVNYYADNDSAGLNCVCDTTGDLCHLKDSKTNPTQCECDRSFFHCMDTKSDACLCNGK